MKHDLSARAVAQRLARLRIIAAVESVEVVRQRLAKDERARLPFAEAVALRLAELHALCELSHHLHERRPRR